MLREVDGDRERSREIAGDRTEAQVALVEQGREEEGAIEGVGKQQRLAQRELLRRPGKRRQAKRRRTRRHGETERRVADRKEECERGDERAKASRLVSARRPHKRLARAWLPKPECAAYSSK